MVSVSNLDNLPALDMYPPSEVPGYYRSESPEVLRVQSRGSQPPASTQKPALQESPLPPPMTPKTPPSFRQENKGKYVLQRIKKRPLSVSQFYFIHYFLGPFITIVDFEANVDQV